MKSNAIRILAITLSLFVAASALAQDKPALNHRKKTVVSVKADAPVTGAEAVAVFAKAESVLRSVNHLNSQSKTVIPKVAAPVTRAQIVREMDRLYELGKPAFKITLPPVRFDSSALSMKDTASAAVLKKLVDRGCIARLGPLATSSKDTLTVAEFGDAIGFFLLRLSDLTHMPSTKWSPYLQSGG